MSFLQPLAFALLALIPVIIAMYLLKLRRTEQQVSSVYLWRRMVRDVEANAPWQKLRRNLLLLLQLLAMLALILALTRPFQWVEGSGSLSTILIIDTSASMAATDASPNRMSAARTQAARVVEDLPTDTRVTIIAAGESPRVLVSSSTDRRMAFQAIEGLAVQAGGSDMEAALQLASAVAARQPDTEIVVFSDGRVNLPERLALQGRLRYLPIGLEGDNQAISLLTLEKTGSERLLTGFAQVTNYAPPGSPAAERRLGIYADGQLVQAFDLTLEPGAQTALVAEGIPQGTQVLEARFSENDLLTLDDRAWAVYRPAEAVAVTLVSEGNRFFEIALGLIPGMELTNVKPADWQVSTTAASQSGRQSLTIFDGFTPQDAQLPEGSLLFVGPLNGNGLFTVSGTLNRPQLRPTRGDDPLLLNLDNFDQIGVLDAARIGPPDWARVSLFGVVGGEETAVLFHGEPQGRRVAVLAFDLRRSDLPLQVAFPVLLDNLLRWLAPPDLDLPAQVAPGESASVALPAGTNVATLVAPDGSQTQVLPQAGRFILPPVEQPGIYTLRWGSDEEAMFPVSLFSPLESAVAPAPNLNITGVDTGAEGSEEQRGRREWWRTLAWTALVFLVAEWIVYHRATLRRLWDRIFPHRGPGEAAGMRRSQAGK